MRISDLAAITAIVLYAGGAFLVMWLWPVLVAVGVAALFGGLV